MQPLLQRRVDWHAHAANNAPCAIDKRATRVTRIYGGICLDEVRHFPRTRRLQRTTERTDDSSCDGPVQAIRIPDGDDQLPDPQRSPSQFCHGQVIGTNTQQSNIDVWFTPDKTGVKRTPIRQRHLHAPRIGNDVGIGQYLTIRGKDETRADATTVFPRGSGWTIPSPLMLQVDTYDRGPNTFRCRHYRTRIGIERLRILCISIYI